MLDLEKIKKLRRSALLNERMFHANMLNVEEEAFCNDMESRYWNTAKVCLQVKSLLDRAMSIHEKLIDFATDKLDKHIDTHIKFSEPDSIFDPYEDLEYALSQEDWIDCLPLHISQYPELLKFSQDFSMIETAKYEAFKECFPGLNFVHKVENSDGETHFIPENELPDGIRNELEINREIKEIEMDHCLDSYDEWRDRLNTMVKNRSPFSEILALFK